MSGPPPTNDPPPAPLAGCLLLVVDDSRSMRLLTQRVLEHSGAKVDCAADGAEALACAKTGGYDLILIDIEMPGMDGYDVAQALRAAGDMTPLVAVTGHQEPAALARCRTGGFAAHVAKPFTPAVLIAAVTAVLPARQCAKPPGSSTAPPSADT